MKLRRMSIVFLDGALSMVDRRKLASSFLRDKKGLAPFLLIDWVLLIHLALKARAERLPALLLCAMPYTGAQQLFGQQGAVADEMFAGRERELSAICDMDGTELVHGGRQLGKTALLWRARNLFHAPDRGEYGILVSAAPARDEAGFVGEVVRGCNERGLEMPQMVTVSGLCYMIRELFGEGRCARLLLLVDEADLLISSFSGTETPYGNLAALLDLRRQSGGRFKAVFAGLRNAAAPGQFAAPLCVGPLPQADAYALLSRPLRHLGFSLDPEKLQGLLVNTVFYPGIIHYAGAKITELLTLHYAEHYNAAGNPPYELTDRHIGAIMNLGELGEAIAARIRLALGADPSYLMLARCAAWLTYYYAGERSCFAAAEILECAALLHDKARAALDMSQCEQLLAELCEMSILTEKDGMYRFRQRRFLGIIGESSSAIEQTARSEARHGGEAS